MAAGIVHAPEVDGVDALVVEVVVKGWSLVHAKCITCYQSTESSTERVALRSFLFIHFIVSTLTIMSQRLSISYLCFHSSISAVHKSATMDALA